MAVKSSKNTTVGLYFKATLGLFVESSGEKKNKIASDLGIAASALGDYLSGIKVPSLAQMEEIATKINRDLVDMLIEGRAILAGEAVDSRPTAEVDLVIPGEKLKAVASDTGDLKDKYIAALEENISLKAEIERLKHEAAG